MTDVPTNNSNNPDDTIQPLAEDNDAPFSQPVQPKLNLEHPSTDAPEELDLQEQYDVGLDETSEANKPSGEHGVLGYNPPNDERTQDTIDDESL